MPLQFLAPTSVSCSGTCYGAGREHHGSCCCLLQRACWQDIEQLWCSRHHATPTCTRPKRIKSNFTWVQLQSCFHTCTTDKGFITKFTAQAATLLPNLTQCALPLKLLRGMAPFSLPHLFGSCWHLPPCLAQPQSIDRTGYECHKGNDVFRTLPLPVKNLAMNHWLSKG